MGDKSMKQRVKTYPETAKTGHFDPAIDLVARHQKGIGEHRAQQTGLRQEQRSKVKSNVGTGPDAVFLTSFDGFARVYIFS